MAEAVGVDSVAESVLAIIMRAKIRRRRMVGETSLTRPRAGRQGVARVEPLRHLSTMPAASRAGREPGKLRNVLKA